MCILAVLLSLEAEMMSVPHSLLDMGSWWCMISRCSLLYQVFMHYLNGPYMPTGSRLMATSVMEAAGSLAVVAGRLANVAQSKQH